MMHVTLMYADGCPNWEITDQRLRLLKYELRYTLEYAKVESPEQSQPVDFLGSPTVLVDGTDPFTNGDNPTGPACRVYATPAGLQGSPTLEQLRAVMG